LIIQIPGRDSLDLKHVIFDYNGTIAIDGKLIKGVADKINQLSHQIEFHVITADTYGTVEKELASVNCQLINLSKSKEYQNKTDYLAFLGKDNTLSVGNGFNDKALLKQSVLGISLIQDEGVCVETLMASDIVCKSIMDVFAYIETPNRLKATLRT
jgi:soluble P-type ATPase